MLPTKSTREQILDLLSQQPCCAGYLAELFKISRVAIHKHLEKLIQDGLIRSSTAPSEGKGRPKQIFELNPVYNAYDNLCGSLLDVVRKQYGNQGVEDILLEHKRSIFKPLAEQTQLSSTQKLEALRSLLCVMGYQAELELKGDTVILRQHQCPAKSVAHANPELCKCEHQTYSDLLGLPILAVSTIAQGANCCTYEINIGE